TTGKTYTCSIQSIMPGSAPGTTFLGVASPLPTFVAGRPVSATGIASLFPGLPPMPGDGSADVWFARELFQSGPGLAITSYRATCTSNDGGATGSGTLSASSSADTIHVAGLTNGKTYACTTAAGTKVGNVTQYGLDGDAFGTVIPGRPAEVIVGTATSTSGQ